MAFLQRVFKGIEVRLAKFAQDEIQVGVAPVCVDLSG
jgi:hypothetical protein